MAAMSSSLFKWYVESIRAIFRKVELCIQIKDTVKERH